MLDFKTYILEAKKITVSSELLDDDSEVFMFDVGNRDVTLVDASVLTKDGVVIEPVDFNEGGSHGSNKVPADVKKWITKELKKGTEITKAFKKKFDAELLKKLGQ